jgi:excisionase family DNA binding protein
MAQLTVTQAATRAACTRKYILNEIRDQRLPATPVGNPKRPSMWLINEADFQAWLDNPLRGSRGKGGA